MSSEYLRIVIIGASAAGLRAAARAGRLMPGAEITVLDRTDVISVSACGLPYLLSGDVGSPAELRSTPYGVLRDAGFFAAVKGLDVKTGMAVEAIDPQAKTVRGRHLANGEPFELSWDALVLATGSDPVAPAGFDSQSTRMHYLRSIDGVRRMRSDLEQGRVGSVVVVGGGFIGCEAAEAYGSMWGAGVTLVEAAPQVLPKMLDPEMAAPVQAHLRANGVTLKLGHPVLRLSDSAETVWVELGNGGGTLSADAVVCALGVRPAVGFAAAAGLETGPCGGLVVDRGMSTSHPGIYAAGDCVELTHHLTGRPVYLPLGSLANRQGRLIGNRLAGRKCLSAPVLGSAVVKVFDITAASTGLTGTAARAAGLDARAAWGSFEDRPAYYPDSSGMHLKLVYEARTLRLLGLQAVGPGQVVREVDVMAGLLQRGGVVQDLLDLEFAYSPPYANALDPLHQLAALVLNGEEDGIRFLPPRIGPEDPQLLGRLVVDVREDEEREAADPGFADSVHLPFTELRARIAELPAKKPLLLVCAKGLRAYEAARILRHAGWDDVVYLGGGAQLRRPQLTPAD
jgi:NADPH-dependent 2,4-dienoyl-CoA reductase/sulfur reductase-like enzyme/rhodanese-related sulfurtransferase